MSILVLLVESGTLYCVIWVSGVVLIDGLSHDAL